ncbi:MAG: helix-turn-helix transcriptional regulator [Christensenellaceae bacterium]
MSVSYKKLWMLILERDMKKTEVRIAAGISPSTFSKMNRNEYVAMEVLVKLCKVLNCNIGDIVDVVHDSD